MNLAIGHPSQSPQRRQPIEEKTTNKLTMTTKWRSKLGHDYDMIMMERNDAKTKKELDRLRLLPANKICADCGKKPTVWASVNLGVFLCIQCGSHHRAIGTHISKPKGCTGTYLWGPDEIANMTTIGNERAQQIYGLGGDLVRPGPGASDVVWRQFLVDKYEKKKFAPPHKTQPPKMTSQKLHDFFGKDESRGIPSPEPDLIHFNEEDSAPRRTPQGQREQMQMQLKDYQYYATLV